MGLFKSIDYSEVKRKIVNELITSYKVFRDNRDVLKFNTLTIGDHFFEYDGTIRAAGHLSVSMMEDSGENAFYAKQLGMEVLDAGNTYIYQLVYKGSDVKLNKEIKKNILELFKAEITTKFSCDNVNIIFEEIPFPKRYYLSCYFNDAI